MPSRLSAEWRAGLVPTRCPVLRALFYRFTDGTTPGALVRFSLVADRRHGANPHHVLMSTPAAIIRDVLVCRSERKARRAARG